MDQAPQPVSVKTRVFINWKTTVQPVLTSILVFSTVLDAQNISLGHVGTGTVVGLISALAKAAIGAWQLDKRSNPDGN